MLSLETYEKIKNRYWVLDNSSNLAYNNDREIWADWVFGAQPTIVLQGYEWRHPTYAEACRRQFEFDNFKMNYAHWHTQSEQTKIIKFFGKNVREIGRTAILSSWLTKCGF